MLRHFEVCKDTDVVSFEVVYGIISGNAIGLVRHFFTGMSARVVDVFVNSCCMRNLVGVMAWMSHLGASGCGGFDSLAQIASRKAWVYKWSVALRCKVGVTWFRSDIFVCRNEEFVVCLRRKIDSSVTYAFFPAHRSNWHVLWAAQ